MENKDLTKPVIRKFMTSDVILMVDMLKKLSSETLPNIIKSVVEMNADKKNKQSIDEKQFKIGMVILNDLYDNLKEEFLEWLGSMVNMNLETFMNADAELSIEIIETLAFDPKYNGFFLRVYNLYKKMPE